MEAFEHELEEAVVQKKVPAILLTATNHDGTFDYFKSFGNMSLAEDSPPVSENSLMILASATKLITCVAAMQCVERGLIGLDDDVTPLLKEWKDARILKDFDEDGKPILVKAENSMTLRQLLSHTSGITGLENEKMMKYYAFLGLDKATLLARYFMNEDPVTKEKARLEILEIMRTLTVDPLLFEPGTSWLYGQGIDWAGQLIERLTHTTLEAYCQANIFIPLSMYSTTYRPLTHSFPSSSPKFPASLISMTSRIPSGDIVNTPSIYPFSSPIDLGGANLYTTAPDFLSLLKSLIRDDEKVLRRETTKRMFEARLPDGEGFVEYKQGDENDGGAQDHCLAGSVNMEDLEGRRKKGSVSWSGATQCQWWLDRKAGIAGFFGTQIMGMGDRKITTGFYEKFERAIYTDHVV